MIRFASVTEVLQIIAEGNNLSEIHYALRNHDVPETLRQLFRFAQLKTRNIGVNLLELFGLKEKVRRLLNL